jgi:uncharacterized protein (DUF433 family)
MQKYISSTPDIMDGALVNKGTRTPIEVILYRLKEGNSVGAIYAKYPWIDVQTFSGAIEEAIQTVTTTLHDKTVPQTQAAAR